MYKLLLVTILSTLLNATNPQAYSVLGDIIYNNVNNIESLKQLNAYRLYKDDIDKYTDEVSRTKALGYKLRKSSSSTKRKEYLNKLRSLSKTNDYFFRSAKNNFNESMKNNNYILFSSVINSGLIDTKVYQEEIINYYYKNKEDINSSGVIDNFLAEDARLKALKDAQKKHYKTKKQLEAEKIKRIRDKDKAVQKKLEEDLQKDLNTKKLEIREVQKKELSN